MIQGKDWPIIGPSAFTQAVSDQSTIADLAKPHEFDDNNIFIESSVLCYALPERLRPYSAFLYKVLNEIKRRGAWLCINRCITDGLMDWEKW